MESLLRTQFEAAVKLFKGSSFNKLLKQPIRLPAAKAMRAYCRLRGRPIHLQAKTFWGQRMTVILPDEVSACLYEYHIFEEGLTWILLELLKPGMTFFDIGSHYGYFSLLGARLVGEKGQVHAFEPTKSTFDVLQRNTQHLAQVRLNNIAIYSAKATIPFVDYGLERPAFNSIFNSSHWSDPNGGGRKYDVQAISIDDYVEQTGVVPDFIKVDAEGAEYSILTGMERTLANHKPLLSMEVGDRTGASSKDVVNLLLDKGYRPVEYAEGRLVEHKPKTEYGYDNLLFRPA